MKSNLYFKIKRKCVSPRLDFILKKIKSNFIRNKLNDNIVLFDTSKGSLNAGDYIIMDYCNKVVSNTLRTDKFLKVSSHIHDDFNKSEVNGAKLKIFCGTNALSSFMDQSNQWNLFENDYSCFRNTCLLGVGWREYENSVNPFTQEILKFLLSKEYIHSVRDGYTEKKLKSIGIKNVINTSCPTMWALNEDFCRQIPVRKSINVLTTITDYRPDKEKDILMLDLLINNYENVYLWLQGKNDFNYLKELGYENKVTLINNNIEELDKLLQNDKLSLDYIGTRLHAGIRCLNYKKRSMIIAVDNRSIEISKDTNLPVINRKDIQEKLEEFIKYDYKTDIKLPIKNIELWKKQFQN